MRTDIQVLLRSDATAAIGIASRQGLGRIRHIATADLWIQQRIKNGDLRVETVNGDDIPTDLMTKALDSVRMERLLRLMSAQLRMRTGTGNNGCDKAAGE